MLEKQTNKIIKDEEKVFFPPPPLVIKPKDLNFLTAIWILDFQKRKWGEGSSQLSLRYMQPQGSFRGEIFLHHAIHRVS